MYNMDFVLILNYGFLSEVRDINEEWSPPDTYQYRRAWEICHRSQ